MRSDLDFKVKIDSFNPQVLRCSFNIVALGCLSSNFASKWHIMKKIMGFSTYLYAFIPPPQIINKWFSVPSEILLFDMITPTTKAETGNDNTFIKSCKSGVWSSVAFHFIRTKNTTSFVQPQWRCSFASWCLLTLCSSG